MTLSFAATSEGAIPIRLVRPGTCEDILAALPGAAAAWARHHGFTGALGQTCALPGAEGRPDLVLLGLGTDAERAQTRFAAGAAIAKLPASDYAIEEWPDGAEGSELALGYLFSLYRFSRYRAQNGAKARLAAPAGLDAARLERIAAGEALTRDLVNTPAEDMGPNALEHAARDLAAEYGADVTATHGESLLDANLPLIHTVGRASDEDPRLIDMVWGSEGPRLTLVGKGVCFDTGGLNLKPGASMGLMKKDMGGAATVLGLARMIMDEGLPLRLRVLIPAVENAVAGNAFRPGDILTARNGKTVEINNTDAEGRLVLADALSLAAEEDPDLLVSMATLTGAARVALGADIAPFYTDDEGLAASLSRAAAEVADPVWRMPFHAPYEKLIEPGIADLDNAPKGGFAGSITAALFLRRFAADARSYAHFDIFAWSQSDAPGRPKGGFGQGARALFQAIPEVLVR
ncbi:leucyl aminopeptidase family protein [Roseibacterium sp. SDUM158016]|uniref:leucyl aminopeptidase family protein n=1 Tax=Roseicyclus sediminis TaxID=2980997 RepID=UPI0021CF0017|nr:leucyl aminopeptidase family protein [Roseibacterium sp. SDUM158016]MCU4652403.1 leucyl aminopeptidase family protein [Roseibacterium sp. SDUM158016]